MKEIDHVPTRFMGMTTTGMGDDEEEMMDFWFLEEIIEVFGHGSSRDRFLPRDPINIITCMQNEIREPEPEPAYPDQIER
jgi:hypothetical protein